MSVAIFGGIHHRGTERRSVRVSSRRSPQPNARPRARRRARARMRQAKLLQPSVVKFHLRSPKNLGALRLSVVKFPSPDANFCPERD